MAYDDRTRAQQLGRANGRGRGPTLITGGAGFIGTNLAHRLLEAGERVVLLDNLSRDGVRANLAWLQGVHGSRLEVHVVDVRDHSAVRAAVAECDHVYHLAAQVAVTTSLNDPVDDFEVNAGGTLVVLEAIRARRTPPSLVFTSTNKVYGALEDVTLWRTPTRYEPKHDATRCAGISERRPLDFHSPYGCSKGCADQYVLDYARAFGLRTAVLRMSCIYGPHQHGNEDQGWVAHFLIRAVAGEPITLYGDGRQVRDLLFVDDLIDAFLLARASISKISGRAFNLGGGPERAVSLLEVIDLIGRLDGREPDLRFDEWRTGDQRYYVSDTASFQAATGWEPRVGVTEGLRRLYTWLSERGPQTPTTVERPAAPLKAVSGGR